MFNKISVVFLVGKFGVVILSEKSETMLSEEVVGATLLKTGAARVLRGRSGPSRSLLSGRVRFFNFYNGWVWTAGVRQSLKAPRERHHHLSQTYPKTPRTSRADWGASKGLLRLLLIAFLLIFLSQCWTALMTRDFDTSSISKSGIKAVVLNGCHGFERWIGFRCPFSHYAALLCQGPDISHWFICSRSADDENLHTHRLRFWLDSFNELSDPAYAFLAPRVQKSLYCHYGFLDLHTHKFRLSRSSNYIYICLKGLIKISSASKFKSFYWFSPKLTWFRVSFSFLNTFLLLRTLR